MTLQDNSASLTPHFHSLVGRFIPWLPQTVCGRLHNQSVPEVNDDRAGVLAISLVFHVATASKSTSK